MVDIHRIAGDGLLGHTSNANRALGAERLPCQSKTGTTEKGAEEDESRREGEFSDR